MSDVFISYSRQNEAFVRKLFDTLIADQREVWVDWQIDYSTRWWEEICAGIEAANNFLFVISADSLKSVYCHRELEHARACGKRLIGFIYEPINEAQTVGGWYNQPYEVLARANWEALKATQWIDFPHKLGGDYDQGIAALIATVDNDSERKRIHTRLLLRLRDWETRGCSPDLLLRGAELAEYESWAATLDTPPTEAQLAFIRASRAEADHQAQIEQEKERRTANLRRARRWFGIAAVLFLGIALIATLGSIAAANETNTQRTIIGVLHSTASAAPPTLTAQYETLVAAETLVADLGATQAVLAATSVALNANNLYASGFGLFLSENYEAARYWFQLAIDAHPSPPAVYYYALGRVEQMLGEFNSALEHFDTSLAVDPHYTLSLMSKAMVQREVDDLAGAWESLAAARAAYAHNRPNDLLGDTAEYRFAILEGSLDYYQEDYQATLDVLLPFSTDAYPSREEVFFYLAYSYDALGKVADACHYARLYANEPSFENAFLLEVREHAMTTLRERLCN